MIGKEHSLQNFSETVEPQEERIRVKQRLTSTSSKSDCSANAQFRLLARRYLDLYFFQNKGWFFQL